MVTLAPLQQSHAHGQGVLHNTVVVGTIPCTAAVQPVCRTQPSHLATLPLASVSDTGTSTQHTSSNRSVETQIPAHTYLTRHTQHTYRE
jgi:hypothetical protein